MTYTIRDRLDAGDTILTAWSAIPDAITVDAVAQASFDAITLDMQHGGHSDSSVLYCLQPVIHRRKGAIVRIPVGRFDMASRALDFGAEAVIAPMINSIEDARLFANAMKYPPVGERSWGPSRALPLHGLTDMNAYLRDANRLTVSIAMIETRAALAIVDDILALDGIDAVFVGPSDFSIAWTHGAELNQDNADMQPAIADIAKRAQAARKIAAIFAMTTAQAQRYRAMGYRLIACSTDGNLLKAGAEAFLRDARA